MRSFVLLSVFFALALTPLALTPLAAQLQPQAQFQPEPLPDAMVQHFCHAPQIASGPELDEVTAIATRLNTDPHIHVVLADISVINAWENDISPEASIVCIPIELVQFMDGAQGELAFILGHEMGHATDALCKSLAGRGRITSHVGAGPVLSILFGRSDGTESADQRACESRADELGLERMVRAGYDPNDAVSALRRLSTTPGFSSTEPLFFARLAALGKDHPITADRIRHLRKRIARSGL